MSSETQRAAFLIIEQVGLLKYVRLKFARTDTLNFDVLSIDADVYQNPPNKIFFYCLDRTSFFQQNLLLCKAKGFLDKIDLILYGLLLGIGLLNKILFT